MIPSLLVADDEPMIRELIKEAFEARGLRVFEAADGEEAYRLMQQNKIDCLISDLKMPGCDGIELVKRARALPQPPTNIFLMSGHLDGAPPLEEVTLVKVLSKPFNFDDLVRQVLDCYPNK